MSGVYVSIRVCAYVFECVCRGQRSVYQMSSIAVHLLRRCLSDWNQWAPAPVAMVTGVFHTLPSHSGWGLNSGPGACAAGTLPRASSQPDLLLRMTLEVSLFF